MVDRLEAPASSCARSAAIAAGGDAPGAVDRLEARRQLAPRSVAIAAGGD
jgi:hypothetical protein